MLAAVGSLLLALETIGVGSFSDASGNVSSVKNELSVRPDGGPSTAAPLAFPLAFEACGNPISMRASRLESWLGFSRRRAF